MTTTILHGDWIATLRQLQAERFRVCVLVTGFREVPTERSGTEHTAPMPRALARRCILAGSKTGDEVLDPFGGSGTVGVVCEEEWRHAVLIDLDERSTAQARRRCGQRAGLLTRPAE